MLLPTLRDASKKKSEEQGWPTAQSLKVISNKRDLVVGHCYVSHAYLQHRFIPYGTISMVATRKKRAGGRTRPTGPHLAIPTEKRVLDVEEATENGSSVENGPSAVATFR